MKSTGSLGGAARSGWSAGIPSTGVDYCSLTCALKAGSTSFTQTTVPIYVGLVGKERLGPRLRDHFRKDRHRGKWNRFSWFGFRKVLMRRDRDGFCELKDLAERAHGQPKKEIADIEALLIQALGLSSNTSRMRFRTAQRWDQVKNVDIDALLAKIEQQRLLGAAKR